MPGRVWEDSGGLQVENDLANCPLSKLNFFHLEEEYKRGGKRKGKSKEKRRKRKEDEEEKEKERRVERRGKTEVAAAEMEEQEGRKRIEKKEERKTSYSALVKSERVRERKRRKVGV